MKNGVKEMVRGGEASTCIIGDIHGCHASLVALLAKVTFRADTIVFLGDYVDRGPEAKAVVETVLALRKAHDRVITLMGNHDYLFLRYLIGHDEPLFHEVGGRETLASYGLSPASSREEVARLIPAAHLSFFSSLPLYWEDQHAIYVHAGLEPGRHLSQQTPQWCLWAREQFLCAALDFGKPVVFGHTALAEPLVTVDKIGIDTGAVYGGQLTALLLPQREFVSVPGLRPDAHHLF